MQVIQIQKSSAKKSIAILLIIAVTTGLILMSFAYFDWSSGGGPGATTAPPSDKDPSMTSCLARGTPTYSIGHLAAIGHAWNANVVYGSSWISLVGQTGNVGKGFIGYSLSPNYTPYSRIGIINIDGYNFVLEQEGYSNPNDCPAQLNRTLINAEQNGGSFRVTVDNWVGNSPWVVEISPNDTSWISEVPEPNSDATNIVIAPNTGNDRITHITVAGTKLPIIQDGFHAPPSP